MKALTFAAVTNLTLNQYVDGVHQIVSSTMASGTYVFTSFSQDYLRAMKTRHPEAKTALISGTAFTAADTSLITTASRSPARWEVATATTITKRRRG